MQYLSFVKNNYLCRPGALATIREIVYHIHASPGMVDSFGGVSVDSSLSDPGKTLLSSEVDVGVSG